MRIHVDVKRALIDGRCFQRTVRWRWIEFHHELSHGRGADKVTANINGKTGS